MKTFGSLGDAYWDSVSGDDFARVTKVPTRHARHVALLKVSTVSGLLVPVAYFGSQLIAQSLTPGYDWRQQLASELGRAGEPAAPLFNTGMGITAAMTLLAIPGFHDALSRLRSGVMSWLVSGCLLASAMATLWAAANPLPSHQHNPGTFLLVGILALPATLAIAFRKAGVAAVAQAYLLVSFAAAAVLLLLNQSDLSILPPGAAQRLSATLVYPPVAVGAYVLLKTAR